MFGMISNAGMGTYPLRSGLAPCTMFSQLVIGQWLRFPHRAGRVRPEGSPFLSPSCQSCRFIKGLIIREWDPIVPGRCCGFILEPQPFSDRQAGLGFPYRAGWFRSWGPPFSSRIFGVADIYICIEGFLNRG